VKGGRVEVLMC